MSVKFFVEDIDEFKIPRRKISIWIKKCIENNNRIVGGINLIFCGDEYLKALNNQYLSKDYYTDIITFEDTNDDTISGDLFISVDRVEDNSKVYKVDFNTELLRVIIHGVLHLLGFADKSNDEIRVMRKQEDLWLKIFFENLK